MNVAYAIPLADSWSMHGNVGWGWMVGMMVAMVLFWGAIILGIAWLIRGGFEARGGRTEAPADIPERRETPTELLERRFAEGTITVEDYQERRKVLANGAAQSDGAPKDEPLIAPGAREGSQ